MQRVIGSLFILLSINALADNTFYGSVNLGLEYRDVKDDALFEDHVQLQDAYSALGIMGEMEVQPGLIGFYNYKVSIDVASGNLYESPQTTWAGPNQDENVAYMGVKGGFGTASFGYQWNAYYNAISYTTDRFSSGWTGFDTYGSFQLNELIVYQSPTLNGISVAVNVQSGADHATGKNHERFLGAVSYNLNRVTLHLGYDDLGSGSTDLMGFAAEYNAPEMRFAVKHEKAKEGLGTQDASLTSIHASYTMGENTFKVHYGFGNYPSYLPVDDSSGKREASEIGIGLDHTINEQFYVFVEFHHSDEYCAYDLTEGNGNGAYDNDGNDGISGNGDDVLGNEIYGCQVFSVGSHYSF